MFTIFAVISTTVIVFFIVKFIHEVKTESLREANDDLMDAINAAYNGVHEYPVGTQLWYRRYNDDYVHPCTVFEVNDWGAIVCSETTGSYVTMNDENKHHFTKRNINHKGYPQHIYGEGD